MVEKTFYIGLYYEQALTIHQKSLGENHPLTATSLLGGLLQMQGDYEGARLYYERALAIRKQVLGEHHPSTATSLNDLGNLFEAQGNCTEARAYYEDALAIFEKNLGSNHPYTKVVCGNIKALNKVLSASKEQATSRTSPKKRK